MAVVRVSYLSMKARLIIAAVMLLVVGLASLFLFLKFREATEPSTSPSAESLVAGPAFEPGAEGRLHGTETEAFLEGLQQKIRAVDPSQEWRDAFPAAECSGEGVETCVADAPGQLPSAPGAPEEGPEGEPASGTDGLLELVKKAIPVEVLPLLALVGIGLVILWEEE